MSISKIQRQRVFEEITRTLFSSGERPRLIDIMREVSQYFSKYPAGVPLPMPTQHIQTDLPVNVDKFNQMLAHVTTNLGVLYEATEEHQQDLMHLTTLLGTNLERLRVRRKKLMTEIDDYLFSLYNTDGYYYSISDVFSDLSLTDLNLTSAFVDTYAGKVSIPTVSHLTNRVPTDSYSAVAIETMASGITAPYQTVSPFQGCVDGLSNTIWAIEIERDQPEEVVAHIAISIGTIPNPLQISKIDIDPYGITPVQMWVKTESKTNKDEEITTIEDFGPGIKTTSHQTSFVDQPRICKMVHIYLRKTEPDYTVERDRKTKYRYIFGIKDLVMTEHVYDNEAVFVSKPLALPREISGDNVIDAVSLVATDDTPVGTSIKYYVAPDISSSSPSIGDFAWTPIDKIDVLNPKSDTIVRFDGALKHNISIRANPGGDDLQLNPIVTTGPPAELNPNPEIIATQDIYRLCSFDEDVLTKSLVLEEGVNTTRIIHADFESGVSSDEALELSYWREFRDNTKTGVSYETIYGRIDTGNGFFSGGDVGEHKQYVYVETYLESLSEQETMLKNFVKVDSNSKVWDIKVYLNGREVGFLPVGVDEVVIPWKFQKGLNHIALTIVIPTTTATYPNPQLGTLNLLGDSHLYDFGTVKLSTWTYVDFFKMQYNETGQPYTFTIYNDELISRRKPTDNFRLKYAKARSTAPDAIRIRADLSREPNNQYVTPSVDLYRLRFIYT